MRRAMRVGLAGLHFLRVEFRKQRRETGATSGSILDAEGAFAVFGACTVP